MQDMRILQGRKILRREHGVCPNIGLGLLKGPGEMVDFRPEKMAVSIHGV
jgi:hypothetical protein